MKWEADPVSALRLGVGVGARFGLGLRLGLGLGLGLGFGIGVEGIDVVKAVEVTGEAVDVIVSSYFLLFCSISSKVALIAALMVRSKGNVALISFKKLLMISFFIGKSSKVSSEMGH